MTLWLALRRLLPLLAVLSLALAPVAASAAAAGLRAPAALDGHPMAMPGMDDRGMDHGSIDNGIAMASDAMPCCPHEAPAVPDCAKGCPLMALCLAKTAPALPRGVVLPVRAAIVQGTAWRVRASFASLTQAPAPEPPRP